MKRAACLCGLALAVFFSATCKKNPPAPASSARPKLFVVGIFQSVDSLTANEARRGILKAFEDSGLRDGENILVRIRIANGDISEVQRIAQAYADEKVDLIMPLSTQCLQAALIAGRSAPIVFGSVATPFLVGAGNSANDHLNYVTGVASTGPVRQTVKFIHDLLPKARRLGTLWTPSEVNSEYYLELARDAASELGLEVVAVPVANAHEIPQAAQILVNEKVDVLYDGRFGVFRHARIARSVHGTGCYLSAAILGYLAEGHGLGDACHRGIALTASGIRKAVPAGRRRMAFTFPVRRLKTRA